MSLLPTGLLAALLLGSAALPALGPASVSAASPGPGRGEGAAVAVGPTVAPHPPTAVQPAHAPQPPAEGAWLGAYVAPDLPTPAGRVAAVTAFEARIGRPLDVAHVFHPWGSAFPDAADRALAAQGRTVLLSWGGTDTREIQAGRYDDAVRAQARALKAWGVPVLLEWRWEMDRPNLQAEVWSPQDYVAAWRHLHALFDEEQVDNAGWVWCPLATGFATGRAQAYFPGDDAVDWLCADLYPGRDAQPFRDAAQPFLDWAGGHPQPVLFGEFGMQEASGDRAREDWLTAVPAFVRTQPQVKGLVWFDADESDRARDAYDTSLRDGSAALAAFRRLAGSTALRSEP